MLYPRRLLIIIFGLGAFAACGSARAQQNIGSTALAENKVSRELAGAAAPLNSGDPVFRNEAVSTGEESKAKLIFLDSTNLAIGPISRVTLDRFVYVGETNSQEMSVNLARGIFRSPPAPSTRTPTGSRLRRPRPGCAAPCSTSTCAARSPG
jgi:hypothetical protein